MKVMNSYWTSSQRFCTWRVRRRPFSLFNPFIAPRRGCGFGWTVVGHLQATDSEIQEFGRTVVRIESEAEGEQSVFIARSVSVCDTLFGDFGNVRGVVSGEGYRSATL